MLEQTKRISFRISSVLSKVEPKLGAGAGPSHRLRPAPTGSATKVLTKKQLQELSGTATVSECQHSTGIVFFFIPSLTVIR